MKNVQQLLIALLFVSGCWLTTDIITPTKEATTKKNVFAGVHVIVEGETLISIARKYAVTVQELRQYNGFLPSRELIYPGDTLLIPNKELTTLEGIASWYGPKFHGKTMANGQKFNMHCDSVMANKELPLNTDVLVINLENGKTAHAKVLDRGPYVEGRDFDVSRALAEKLGFRKDGLAQVRVVILPNKSRFKS